MSGTSMVTNAPAVRTCQSSPRGTDQLVELSGEHGHVHPAAEEDQRHQRSFHTHRNWKWRTTPGPAPTAADQANERREM